MMSFCLEFEAIPDRFRLIGPIGLIGRIGHIGRIGCARRAWCILHQLTTLHDAPRGYQIRRTRANEFTEAREREPPAKRQASMGHAIGIGYTVPPPPSSGQPYNSAVFPFISSSTPLLFKDY